MEDSYRVDVILPSYVEKQITSGKLRRDSPIIVSISVLSNSKDPMSGSDILKVLGYNRSDLHNHLMDLESSGLVASETFGNVRKYTITDKGKIANSLIQKIYGK